MKKVSFCKIIYIVIAITLVFNVVGCGDTEDNKLIDKLSQENLLYETKIVEKENEENTVLAGADVVSLTDFAVRLFQQSLEENENTLISPLSMVSALGMTANGAKGETLSQMEQVFGIRVPELNEYLSAYRESLPEDNAKYKLSIANAIWLRDEEGVMVEEDFLQANAKYYEAAVYKMPFDASTIKAMNEWVSVKTDGMIENIFDKISQDAVMYLINAIGFDAEWQEIYYAYQVRDGEFTKADGTKQNVEFMYSEENAYLDDDNAVGFVKYYADKKYAFATLLPKEGISLSDYIAALNGDKLHSILSKVSDHPVNAAIPKFQSEYSAEMSEVLKEMGMTDAFCAEVADFSGMGHSENGNLHISRILHKTFIAVDEQGTKAGAATVVEMADGAAMIEREPVNIYLDRPFLYMIIDCESNIPVFIGVVQHLDE